jgi:Xaa-Pro aminopeptidase
VSKDGYCADLQRMWYVLEPGQSGAPDEVTHVWNGVRKALLAGAEALKPGALGWQVDEAARGAMVQAGLPEYQHAFGHHIGRSAHDGATVLGPRWERYGRSPFGEIEEGNCFAIELGARVEGRGWVYLEENVRVTEKGLEWLSQPQMEIRLIHAN